MQRREAFILRPTVADTEEADNRHFAMMPRTNRLLARHREVAAAAASPTALHIETFGSAAAGHSGVTSPASANASPGKQSKKSVAFGSDVVGGRGASGAPSGGIAPAGGGSVSPGASPSRQGSASKRRGGGGGGQQYSLLSCVPEERRGSLAALAAQTSGQGLSPMQPSQLQNQNQGGHGRDLRGATPPAFAQLRGRSKERPGSSSWRRGGKGGAVPSIAGNDGTNSEMSFTDRTGHALLAAAGLGSGPTSVAPQHHPQRGAGQSILRPGSSGQRRSGSPLDGSSNRATTPGGRLSGQDGNKGQQEMESSDDEAVELLEAEMDAAFGPNAEVPVELQTDRRAASRCKDGIFISRTGAPILKKRLEEAAAAAAAAEAAGGHSDSDTSSGDYEGDEEADDDGDGTQEGMNALEILRAANGGADGHDDGGEKKVTENDDIPQREGTTANSTREENSHVAGDASAEKTGAGDSTKDERTDAEKTPDTAPDAADHGSEKETPHSESPNPSHVDEPADEPADANINNNNGKDDNDEVKTADAAQDDEPSSAQVSPLPPEQSGDRSPHRGEDAEQESPEAADGHDSKARSPRKATVSAPNDEQQRNQQENQQTSKTSEANASSPEARGSGKSSPRGAGRGDGATSPRGMGKKTVSILANVVMDRRRSVGSAGRSSNHSATSDDDDGLPRDRVALMYRKSFVSVNADPRDKAAVARAEQRRNTNAEFIVNLKELRRKATGKYVVRTPCRADLDDMVPEVAQTIIDGATETLRNVFIPKVVQWVRRRQRTFAGRHAQKDAAKPSIDQLLRLAPMFEAWPAESLRRIVESLSFEFFERGTFIAHTGERTIGIYFLTSGTLQSVHLASGVKHTIQCPYVLGLGSVLEDTSLTLSYKAVSHRTEVWVMPASVLLHELRTLPPEKCVDFLKLGFKKKRESMVSTFPLNNDHLRTSSIFAPVPPTGLREIIRAAVPHAVPKSHILYWPNQKGDRVLILLRGTCKCVPAHTASSLSIGQGILSCESVPPAGLFFGGPRQHSDRAPSAGTSSLNGTLRVGSQGPGGSPTNNGSQQLMVHTPRAGGQSGHGAGPSPLGSPTRGGANGDDPFAVMTPPAHQKGSGGGGGGGTERGGRHRSFTGGNVASMARRLSRRRTAEAVLQSTAVTAPAVFGDDACIAPNGRYDHALVTTSQCDFYSVPKTVLDHLMRTTPDVATALRSAFRGQRETQMASQRDGPHGWGRRVLKFPFLKDVLPPARVQLLARLFQPVVYQPVSVVCSTAEPCDRVILLLSGKVIVGDTGLLWEPGTFAGFTAGVVSHRWATSAITQDLTETLEMPLDLYVAFLKDVHLFETFKRMALLLLFPKASDPDEVVEVEKALEQGAGPVLYPVSSARKMSRAYQSFIDESRELSFLSRPPTTTTFNVSSKRRAMLSSGGGVHAAGAGAETSPRARSQKPHAATSTAGGAPALSQGSAKKNDIGHLLQSLSSVHGGSKGKGNAGAAVKLAALKRGGGGSRVPSPRERQQRSAAKYLRASPTTEGGDGSDDDDDGSQRRVRGPGARAEIPSLPGAEMINTGSKGRLVGGMRQVGPTLWVRRSKSTF